MLAKHYINKFNRILFTGDLVRINPHKPNFSNQCRNIIWLKNIVGIHLENIGLTNIETIMWDEESKDKHNLYSYLQLQPNLKNYLDIYQGKYNDKLQYKLYDIYSDSFVIGFEIPQFLIKYFNDSKIPYIDVALSPIRFAPDTVVAVRSNCIDCAHVLSRNQLNELEIKLFASWRTAYFSKMNLRKFPKNSAIFAGQVAIDNSKIHKNNYLDLENFESEILELSKQQNIYFKPHPYVTKDALDKQTEFMKNIGCKTILNNLYYLFHCGGVEKIISISSSACIEAKYFNKQSQLLIDYPFTFSEKNAIECDIFYNIYRSIVTSKFWSEIFNLPAQKSLILPEGGIRQSLGQNWGADIFYKDSALPTNKKTKVMLANRIVKKITGIKNWRLLKS